MCGLPIGLNENNTMRSSFKSSSQSFCRIKLCSELESAPPSDIHFSNLPNSKIVSVTCEGLPEVWMNDIITDHNSLCALHKGIVASKMFYPQTGMSNTGIINLGSEEQKVKNDGLFKILSSAYTSQNPRYQSINRRKVTFVTLEGVATKSIEFQEDKDYWGLLYAIKRSSSGQNVDYSGFCVLILNSSEENSRPKTQRTASTTGILSMLGGGNSKDPNFASITGTRCTIEVNNLIVKAYDNGNVVFNVDLSTIIAIFITMNSNLPSDLLMECSIQNEESLLSLDDAIISNQSSRRMNSHDLYSLRFLYRTHLDTASSTSAAELAHVHEDSFQPYFQLSTMLMLPLSEKDVIECAKAVGINDDIHQMPFSVNVYSHQSGASQIYSTVAGNSLLSEGDVIVENVIPYSSFLKMNEDSSPSSTISLDPVDVQLAMKRIGLRRAIRVVIQSATEIPCSNKDIPPSVYCTVYLVGENGEKLSSNSLETRTDVIKSQNPVWNREIFIPIDALEGIAGVMVKLRDSASGFLKHKHIGQSIIPIACFLYHTEAEFSLPLEATYRYGMLM